MLASDAFDLAPKSALPKRAPSEPGAPASFHRAFPYTPEPVDSQPPVSRRSCFHFARFNLLAATLTSRCAKNTKT